MRGVFAEARTVLTRPGLRWLLVVTLLLGAGTAVLLGLDSSAGVVAVAGPVHSVMSIVLPIIGILMVRAADPGELLSTVAGALVVAVGVGLAGVAFTALGVALADTGPTGWDRFAAVALGGVLVQVMTLLVGTGVGLLVRPLVPAILVDVVLPVGLWAALGAVGLRTLQQWTPYAVVQDLTSGRMAAPDWALALAVVLLWGVGPTALGLLVRRPTR